MSILILRIFGLFLMIFISVFAFRLWLGITKMEKKIEAEKRDSGEDEI